MIAVGAMFASPLFGAMQANALTISPILIEYDVDPGDAIVGSIKLTNEGDASETYHPLVQDFVAADEMSGSPSFVGMSDTRSLVKWVSFKDSSITLEPGETVYASYNITVPKEALPGGYSGALLFSTSAGEVTEGVGAVGASGPLLLIRVSGNLVEQGAVTDFSAVQDSTTSLPVNFMVRFVNEGTVHVKPTGVIRITNMFGGTSAVIPVNEAGGNVLADSARQFSAEWQKMELPEGASELVKEWKNFAFGPYTATLILNYGEANQVATATTSFWVMPWMLVVLFIILLVILALLVMQYNKWIVAQAMKGRK